MGKLSPFYIYIYIYIYESHSVNNGKLYGKNKILFFLFFSSLKLVYR